jgi:prenyltransferase beta subunit
LQEDDGGWSFDANSQSDTNTTATAIQALLAGGREATSESITDALDFLRTQQNSDGGFPYQNPSEYGTETDANSTAYVIQALLAAGQDLSDWNNPTQALAALQLPDGAFEYQKGTGANLLATVQAVPVLAGKTLLDLPRVAASQAPAPETSTGSTPATLPTTGGTGSRAFDLAIAGLVLLGGGLSLTTLARRGAR